MRRIIFVTGTYLPKPSATAYCAHNIASFLVDEGYDAYTVAYSENGNNTIEVYDRVKVYKIKMPSFLRRKKRGLPFINRARGLFNKFIHLLDYPLKSNRLCSYYYSQIEKLIVDESNTTVVGTFTPLEAIVAVCKIKESYPRINAVFYSLDTLSNEAGTSGILPKSLRKAFGYKWEKYIFSVVDRILVMECHYDHYKSQLYHPFSDKINVVNFPLIVKKDWEGRNDNYEKIVMVYAGTLDKRLRNPSFMCRTLVDINKKVDIDVQVMGGGDCQSIMEKWSELSGGVIRYHGMMPHDIAEKKIQNADILLSIGNNESPMAPSKIYEYMSTGKPIIHFYTWDKDPCLQPLKLYGNALLIKMGEGINIDELVSFVRVKGIVPFEAIETIFKTATPSYTARLIEEL